MKSLQVGNKKAVTTIALVVVIFFGFFLLIGLVVLAYAMGLIDSAMSTIDVNLGNVSFNTTYNDYVKPSIVAAETTVPRTIGLGTLIGMTIILLFVGWKMPKISELWILFDIIIIIIAEIIALYLKESFTTFMNSDPQILAILSNQLSGSATFILNLPIIVPTIGAALMAITYMKSRKKELEEFQ